MLAKHRLQFALAGRAFMHIESSVLANRNLYLIDLFSLCRADRSSQTEDTGTQH